MRSAPRPKNHKPQPTSTIYTEQAVIAGLFRAADQAAAIIDLELKPDLFTVDPYRRVFATLTELLREELPIDYATLEQRVEPGDITMLHEAVSTVISDANWTSHARLLKEAHTRREQAQLRNQAAQALLNDGDPEEIRGMLEALQDSSRARGKKAVKPSYPSYSARSITYSFTTRHQPDINSSSPPPKPVIIPVPDLETVDEKGRPAAVIDSFAARAVAEALAGRLAFCREAMIWHGFTGTHWEPYHNPAVAEELVAKILHAGTPTCGFKANYLMAVASLLRKGLLPLPEPSAAGKIPFTNGLLDPRTRTLTPITPSNALTWSLPYTYDPAADCPTVKTWLHQAVNGDPETVEFLRAWLAALLTGRTDLQKFLHLFGPGGTGKGAFIRLATALVGSRNTVVTDLRNLEQNRFETAALYGKRLATITDTSRYGGSVDVLKAMTGQDQLRLERKHQQQGATFTFEGLVLLASNEAIQTTDHTSAIERRRLTVVFERIASPEERRLWAQQGGETGVLHREIPGVVNWCLQLTADEVSRRIARRSARIDAANLEALQSSNPIAGWLMDNTIPEPGYKAQIGDKRPTIKDGLAGFESADEWLYPNYLTWCQRNGREALSLTRFSGLVLDMAPVLKFEVEKKREMTGRFLIGLRLRRDYEAAFEWPMTAQPVIACRVDVSQSIDSAEYDGYDGLNAYSHISARERNDAGADAVALVAVLHNGYRGHDPRALMEGLGWDVGRWEAARDEAITCGLIRAEDGRWYPSAAGAPT